MQITTKEKYAVSLVTKCQISSCRFIIKYWHFLLLKYVFLFGWHVLLKEYKYSLIFVKSTCNLKFNWMISWYFLNRTSYFCFKSSILMVYFKISCQLKQIFTKLNIYLKFRILFWLKNIFNKKFKQRLQNKQSKLIP